MFQNQSQITYAVTIYSEELTGIKRSLKSIVKLFHVCFLTQIIATNNLISEI